MDRFTNAVIAIFMIVFSDYDSNRMMLKYGENSNSWQYSSGVALLIDIVLFLYGWYLIVKILFNDKSN